MKLRRAMALAAATAVIAPAALLAAPAAYADGDPATTTTQSETTDPGEATDPDAATDPGATDPDTETDPATDPDGESDPTDPDPSDTDPATDPDSETDPGTDPATDPETDPSGDDPSDTDPATDPDGDTDPATDPEADPSGDDPATDPDGETDPADDEDPAKDPEDEPGEDEDPATDPGEFEPCEPVFDEDGDMIDAASALQLDINGLPGKIVAGSGWHNFQMTASNPTDEALGEVRWIAFVDNYTDSDNEKDWLSQYVDLQYLNQDTKTWKPISDFEFMGKTELGAQDVVDIQLRLNIDAKAPAGDSFALGFGAYLDSDEECYRQSMAAWDFTVLAPGSDNPNPGKPKPVDPPKQDEQPVTPKEPQGGAKEIPVTGSLAETGSSSAVPMFALAGGAAVAVGVGAMFVVRRRKAGSEA